MTKYSLRTWINRLKKTKLVQFLDQKSHTWKDEILIIPEMGGGVEQRAEWGISQGVFLEGEEKGRCFGFLILREKFKLAFTTDGIRIVCIFHQFTLSKRN